MELFLLEGWKPRKRLHHFSTCSFFSMLRVIGVGWGGWGGDVYIRCTCTHVWCYVRTSSSADVNVLWICSHPQSTELEWFSTHLRARTLARELCMDVKVSLVILLVLILHTCLMLRKNIVIRRCQRSLNMFTPAVYRIRVVFDTFACSHTCTWVVHACESFSGDLTRLDLAHMFDAT